MIRGRFDEIARRPIVAGHIVIPSIRIRGPVSFLLDTGADGTVIMPMDAARLGIDFARFRRTAVSYGIGGRSNDYVAPAVFVIADGSTLHAYEIELRLPKPRRELSTAPSLLGRDTINRWRILLDHSANRSEIEIVSSDLAVPVR